MPAPTTSAAGAKAPISLLGLSRALAEKETTPLEIVETLLARIKERDRSLQAWAYIDTKGARQAAEAAGREIAAGKGRGPLHGIPFGVKDIFDTAGMPTCWGSPLYAGRIPASDAALVAQLKAAGAITLGYVIAGLFFLRFWKRTREGLFLSFACAFWLLGLTQALLTFTNIPVEERSWLFLLRLAAFSLILISIFRKNRAA